MASKTKTGLARVRVGDANIPSTNQVPAHQALSQMSIPGKMNDTLVNLMTGMGTEKDKSTGTVFGYSSLGKAQLDAAYRGDWISRKAVDIPSFDAFREWRSWQVDKKDITALENTEKKMRVLRKAMLANIRGRLYGGGALIMGVDQGISSDELIIENLGKDSLKFVHAVSRWDLSSGELDWDPMSPYFGEPKYYTISGKLGQSAVRIHPSRVVRFCGMEAADPNITDGWGDSILQIAADAIIACGTVANSTAQLVSEAKIDIVKIPEFTEKISTLDYENRLKRRFGLAATMKSVFGMLVVDAAEEWDRINQTFTGLPDLLKMYLLIVTGAVDVPATRFLGQSPAGLNASGESDTRNYYDRVGTEQNIVISPAMERLDRVIVRSSLGTEPDGIFYEWNALWQMTDVEKADVAVKKAQVITADVNAALISPLVLQKARENQLIEDNTYPGLEQFIEEFGDNVNDRQAAEAEAAAAALAATNAAANPNDPNAPPAPAGAAKGAAPTGPQSPAPPPAKATSAKGAKAVGDRGMNKRLRDGMRRKTALDDATTPRTLYVRRNVLNQDEIAAWAKGQGFDTVLNDMHVTIMYCKVAVDWIKVGTDDYGPASDDGKVKVKKGGPRVMERFGKAVVLAFANSDLSYRHRSMKYRCEDQGVEKPWAYDDYTPHVTITYDAGSLDIMQLDAYQGEIILGPEIFEEIDIVFNNEVDVSEVPPDEVQPQADAITTAE